MKTLLALLVFVAGTLALPAAENAPQQPRPDLFREAVKSYVEAAQVQMQAYRWELDAATKSSAAEKERLAPAYVLLKRGEELIIRLRSAAPSEFDAVKSLYEKNRADLERTIRPDARHG